MRNIARGHGKDNSLTRRGVVVKKNEKFFESRDLELSQDSITSKSEQMT